MKLNHFITASFIVLLLVSAAHAAGDENRFYLDGLSSFQSGKYESAEKSFMSALSVNPKHVSSLFMMGETLSKDMRRLTEAEGWYRKAMRDGGEDKVLMPKFLFSLGVLYMRLGRYEDAAAKMQELLSRYPDFYEKPKAFNHLGVALYRLDRYDEAAAAFKTALKLNPGLLEATFNMKALQGQLSLLNTARYYLRMGDDGSAIEQLNKAVEAYPNYVAAWYQLGLVYLGRKDYSRAVKFLVRARALGPGYQGGREIPYHLAEAYKGRGEPGDMDEALRLYNANIAYKDSALKAGVIYLEQGLLDQAEKDLKVSAENAENKEIRAEALNQLGRLYQKKNDGASAEECFRKAGEVNPPADPSN